MKNLLEVASRSRQRGAAVLTVVMTLLMVTTGTTLYSARSVLDEHRSSAQAYRRAQAYNAGLAALTLARMNLNALAIPVDVDDVNVGGMVQLTDSEEESTVFRVGRSANAILGMGCADVPADGADDCPAQVIVRQATRMLNITPPEAPLIARREVELSGDVTVTHIPPPGYIGTPTTVKAGDSVSLRGAAATAVGPGRPRRGATDGVEEHSPDLSTLTAEEFFFRYFGETKESLRASAHAHVSCDGVCNDDVAAARGRVIWVDGDTKINADITIGSPEQPVILIVDGELTINGSATIYGMVYSTALVWDNRGGGTAEIVGSALAENDFEANGTPDMRFDYDVIGTVSNTHVVIFNTVTDDCATMEECA